MTIVEFTAELARLEARKRVRPATPEYLAEIDAKIEKLRGEFAGPSAIVSNIPAPRSSLSPAEIRAIKKSLQGSLQESLAGRQVEVDEFKLGWGMIAILRLSCAIDDLQFGISQIPNKLPESPPEGSSP